MRILLLTHRVPYPPDRGDRIRSYHLLKYLSRRARVSLASVTDEKISPASRKELDRLCEQVAIAPISSAMRAVRDVGSLVRGRSATEGHFWSPALAATLHRWVSESPFDAVVCFCSGMYRYTRLKEVRDVLTVVDLVDVDSEKWAECAAQSRLGSAWLKRIESQRVRKLEEQIACEADRVVVISHHERELLQTFISRPDVLVASNGVDTDYFRPQEPAEAEQNKSCCFVGVLNYQPNVEGLRWFTRNVWPTIHERSPDSLLNLVGKSPAPEVRAMAAIPGVRVHADVPDVRPYLEASTVAIAPLQIARGIQNKVLEAMAMGLPVVATPQALTGINATHGVNAAQAETPEEWATQLRRLLENRKLGVKIGQAARECVLQRYSWPQKLAPFGNALGLQKAGSANAANMVATSA